MSAVARTALVTGGGTGIGRGIALALARRGVAVALAGRRQARLEAVAAEVRSLGGRAFALPTDLSASSERRALLGRVHDVAGPLDILVNNAGVLAGGDLLHLTPDQIERAVAVNLSAPIELTGLALPELARRRGTVVLVASGAGVVPLPASSVYAATKAGVRAFGESLRYELGPLGVRLLVAYPPPTDTAMTRGMARAGGVPFFPRSRPEDVGERIVRTLWRGRRGARAQELHFPSGERALHLLYRLAPGLVRLLLATQRERFARIMLAPGEGEVE